MRTLFNRGMNILWWGLAAVFLGIFIIRYQAHDYELQQQLATNQARLDVMMAGEIYKAELGMYMEMCTGLNIPPEMCIMGWVSSGKQ